MTTLTLAERIIANRVSQAIQQELALEQANKQLVLDYQTSAEMLQAAFTMNLAKVQAFFTQVQAAIVHQVEDRAVSAERPLERLPEYADPYKLIVGDYSEFTQDAPEILSPVHPYHSAWLAFEGWARSEGLDANIFVEPAYGNEPYRYSLVVQVMPSRMPAMAQEAEPEPAEKKRFSLVTAMLSLLAGLSLFGEKEEPQPWYSEV